jgi:tetratricopeptide (TPR) repeat protein
MLYNYFRSHDKEEVMARLADTFRNIEMLVGWVEMALMNENWEEALKAAEEIKGALDSVKSEVERMPDQNVYDIVAYDMEVAADFLVKELGKGRTHFGQLSAVGMAYWISHKILKFLGPLKYTTEALKYLIDNSPEITTHSESAENIRKGINALEGAINYWEEALEQDSLIDALGDIEPERVGRLTYRFVYKPLMEMGVLPEEKRRIAQDYLWRIFEALASLEAAVRMLPDQPPSDQIH